MTTSQMKKTRSRRASGGLGRITDSTSACSARDRRDRRRREADLRKLSGDLAHNYRISACGCQASWVAQDGPLDIKYCTESGAHVAGLARCENVWLCPSCARKIAAGRSEELTKILTEYRKQGGYVMLVTLTMPHKKSDSLDDMRDALKAAKLRLNRGRGSLRNITGYEHSVTATECNYSKINGWHLHQHILLFFAPPASYGKITKENYWKNLQDSLTPLIRDRWCDILAAIGRRTPRPDVACDVRGGTKAADYVSKGGWGLAEECTQSHRKSCAAQQKKQSGCNPLQLLEAAALGEAWARRAYAEYAKSIKGARMLVRSKSLAEFARNMQIEEKTDAEILAEEESEAVTVAQIMPSTWYVLCLERMEADLLHYVETLAAAAPPDEKLDLSEKVADWLKRNMPPYFAENADSPLWRPKGKTAV